LRTREAIQENVYPRLAARLEFEAPAGRPEVSLFDLINAVSSILNRFHDREETRDVFEDRWTVSEKIESLSSRFQTESEAKFSELFASSTSRLEVVVTFLALLELIRLRRLEVFQAEPFGEIIIRRSAGPQPVNDPSRESPSDSSNETLSADSTRSLN